jgi:hypothetical protein
MLSAQPPQWIGTIESGNPFGKGHLIYPHCKRDTESTVLFKIQITVQFGQ